MSEAQPLDQLVEINGLDFLPIVGETDDRIRGGRHLPVGSTRKASAKHDQDFLSVDHDGREGMTKGGARHQA